MNVGAVSDAISEDPRKWSGGADCSGVILRQVSRPGLRSDGDGLPEGARIAGLFGGEKVIVAVVVQRERYRLRLAAALRKVTQAGECVLFSHGTTCADLL